MVISSGPEIIATAVTSFVLGWKLRNSSLFSKLLTFRLPTISNTKMVIVVRHDLPMSKGKLAAQCSHAAVACYRQGLKTCPEVTKMWLLAGEPKIVLRSDLPGENGINMLSEKAAKAGLVSTIIRDEGRTQVARGTVTVLGIGPGSVRKIDEVTSHLKLL